MKVDKKFIESYDYECLMFKYLNGDENMFLSAEKTKNFMHRAKDLYYLGAWRWMSVFQYRHFISEYIFSDQRGLDFGGAKGPIGGNTLIVDITDDSLFKDLLEFDSNSIDYIFSSHTLEHIKNFIEELVKMNDVLRKGGKLIFILPSYKCKRWNPMGIEGGHHWTFILSSDEKVDNFEDVAYYNEFFRIIDEIIEEVDFKIIQAEYCWDSSIFIFAEKR